MHKESQGTCWSYYVHTSYEKLNFYKPGGKVPTWREFPRYIFHRISAEKPLQTLSYNLGWLEYGEGSLQRLSLQITKGNINQAKYRKL